MSVWERLVFVKAWWLTLLEPFCRLDSLATYTSCQQLARTTPWEKKQVINHQSTVLLLGILVMARMFWNIWKEATISLVKVHPFSCWTSQKKCTYKTQSSGKTALGVAVEGANASPRSRPPRRWWVIVFVLFHTCGSHNTYKPEAVFRGKNILFLWCWWAGIWAEVKEEIRPGSRYDQNPVYNTTPSNNWWTSGTDQLRTCVVYRSCDTPVNTHSPFAATIHYWNRSYKLGRGKQRKKWTKFDPKEGQYLSIEGLLLLELRCWMAHHQWEEGPWCDED